MQTYHSDTYVGIDVGAKGAMTILTDEGIITSISFKDSIEPYIHHLRGLKISLVGIEKVSAMPGQGVTSMFTFGQRYGELIAMCQCLELPYILIQPKQWQKACLIPAKSDKRAIAEHIKRLYPSANLYGARGGLLDGVSDSLGIAHFTMLYKKGQIR